MKKLLVAFLFLASMIPPAWAVSDSPKTKTSAAKGEVPYNPDVDLANAPSYYRKRVIEFRNLLRKETTREAKVRKAVSIAKDPRSKYLRDAIEFLGVVRAKEAVPALIDISNVPNETEFAVHALGEIRDARAVPTFIRLLSDESDNVRGNAYRALEKTTKRSFSYRYDDVPDARASSIAEIQRWWAANSSTFKVQEATSAEAAEAEEAWQKFGRQYLQDLNR
jgi:hypothetical protein